MCVVTRYGPFERWRYKLSTAHVNCIHTALHQRDASTYIRETQ